MTVVMSVCASHTPGIARDLEEVFGREFRRGLGEATDAIRAFDPTLVVLFGSDHRRAFTTVVPAVAVCRSARGFGDHGTPEGEYRVPEQAADALTASMLAAGIDVARASDIALDHGFGQAAQVLLGGLDAYPVIPVFLNCATAPLPPPARAATVGRLVGQLVTGDEERVLFLGSGGLSHDPPTLALVDAGLPEEERRAISLRHRDAAKERIRPEWDLAFLERLGHADTSWTEEITQSEIDPAGIGANEARNWIAAYRAAGLPMRTVVYERVDEWITGMAVAMSEPRVIE